MECTKLCGRQKHVKATIKNFSMLNLVKCLNTYVFLMFHRKNEQSPNSHIYPETKMNKPVAKGP